MSDLKETCPRCGSEAHHKDKHGNVVFCCGSQPFMQVAGPRFHESSECLRRQITALRAEVARLTAAERAVERIKEACTTPRAAIHVDDLAEVVLYIIREEEAR